MNSKLNLFCLAIVILLISAACSNQAKNTTADESATAAAEDTIVDEYIPHGYIILESDSVKGENIENRDSLEREWLKSLPAERREHILKCRKEVLIVLPFILLENLRYNLTLTREEAVKLGVSSEGYDRIVGELNDANRQADEDEAKGIKVERIDFQKVEIDPSFITEL